MWDLFNFKPYYIFSFRQFPIFYIFLFDFWQIRFQVLFTFVLTMKNFTPCNEYNLFQALQYPLPIRIPYILQPSSLSPLESRRLLPTACTEVGRSLSPFSWRFRRSAPWTGCCWRHQGSSAPFVQAPPLFLPDMYSILACCCLKPFISQCLYI